MLVIRGRRRRGRGYSICSARSTDGQGPNRIGGLGLDPVGRSVESGVSIGGVMPGVSDVRCSCRRKSEGVQLRLGLRRGSSWQCAEAVRCW